HPEIAHAWEADHREGTISQSYVGKLRSDLGLTRRSRPSSKAKSEGGTARRPVGRPPKRSRVEAVEAGSRGDAPAAGRSRRGEPSIESLEAEFDRLLFQVMSLGTMPEVEA